MEQQFYFSEILMLALWLGAPVFAAFGAGVALLLMRRSMLARTSVVIATILLLIADLLATLAVWVGIGFLNIDLPEPLFMIAGAVNLPALVASGALLAGLMLATRRRPRTSEA